MLKGGHKLVSGNEEFILLGVITAHSVIALIRTHPYIKSKSLATKRQDNDVSIAGRGSHIPEAAKSTTLDGCATLASILQVIARLCFALFDKMSGGGNPCTG